VPAAAHSGVDEDAGRYREEQVDHFAGHDGIV
jgi:hypothetical protein